MQLPQDTESFPTPAFVDPELAPGALRLSYRQLAATPARPRSGHVSVSQVTGFEKCGLAYRLGRLTSGITQRPSWALVGGKAFHRAAETYDRDGQADWPGILVAEMSETAVATGVPMDRWYAPKKGAEGYTWWLANGAEMLSHYALWSERMTSEGWKLHEAEASWTQQILVGGHLVEMTGVIDQVRVNADLQEAMIVDIKTGSRVPDDSFQLRVYRWAKGQAEARVRGAWYMARTAKRVDVELPAYSDIIGEIEWRVGAMIQGVDAGAFFPHPTSMCAACSVADACPARGNR